MIGPTSPLNIVIIGTGRIALPLADTAHRAGHNVTLVARTSSSASRLGALGDVDATSIQWSQTHLVVLAVLDAGLTLCRQIIPANSQVPIASVLAGASVAEMNQQFPNSSIVRFMCSSAVRHEEGNRFAAKDPDSSIAFSYLQDAFPGNWQLLSLDAFGRCADLLIAGAIVCAALERFSHLATATNLMHSQMPDILKEAELMARMNDNNLSYAFDSAATPDGITEHMFREVFGLKYCGDSKLPSYWSAKTAGVVVAQA